MPLYIDPKGVSQEIGIHVQRGRDLVNKDLTSLSDPYVVVTMGKQKLKTPVVDDNLNPKWDCHLILSIPDSGLPVQLSVYDKDPLWSERMGNTVIDIKPFLAAVGNKQASAQNSRIEWKDGKLVQNMSLKLQNVKSGEVELQLYWPTSKG